MNLWNEEQTEPTLRFVICAKSRRLKDNNGVERDARYTQTYHPNC